MPTFAFIPAPLAPTAVAGVRQRLPRAAVLVLLPLVVGAMGGCAHIAPSAPDTHSAQGHAYRHAADERKAGFDEAAWWATLGDSTLSALIAQAQSNNLDVRIALERVREARAGSTQAASRLLPTLALAASASDERSGLPTTVKQGSPDTRAYRAALELGWEVDVFGAARAAAEAADLDAQTAALGVDAARWLLHTELARQYLLWQGTRLRLETLERLLQAQRDTERLVRSREVLGQASRFDVSRAAGEVHALQAQLPPLRALVSVIEHQIALLLGQSPGVPVRALDADRPAGLPAPAPMPVGQPLELLQRRPDLRVAERRFMAEAARLREAEADLWPKFFLAAVLGRQDLRLNGSGLSPVRFSQSALAFSLPLFNAGRLRAAVQRQDARQRGVTLEYERAVLGALKDVEDSLVALEQERQRAAALGAALDERRTALRHADALLREGQIDLLQRLDVQRGLLSAELAETDSRLQTALGSLQLFKALGGGWTAPGLAAVSPQKVSKP
ncbi:efflux transporter outer membrane subunit [Hydrogenophaga sp.]|uniref:efflux transporter outer membrane subunit n=1 Tax=Hydrogenophaga sp. TaxID=1904254 RepID=UPI003AF69940